MDKVKQLLASKKDKEQEKQPAVGFFSKSAKSEPHIAIRDARATPHISHPDLSKADLNGLDRALEDAPACNAM